jgi:ribosomal protein S16
MFNWLKGVKTMNPLEEGAQKIAITLLNDLKINHSKIQSFITSGAVPSEMAKIMVDIERILTYLKPLLNVIDTLIPPTMPELKLVLDWALKVIDAMPE